MNRDEHFEAVTNRLVTRGDGEGLALLIDVCPEARSCTDPYLMLFASTTALAYSRNDGS